MHFEVIPDHLPDKLKDMIAQFPPGVLQFEVGIQSFNVEVQQRISRRQDNDKTVANLGWLVNESNAHLHTDLIFGLPGESLQSFGEGFDRLFAIKPHEIQLGILKRLRGTPIARHTVEHGMVYDALPPYQIQQTNAVSAVDMQRFARLARYWDLVANSGRFGGAMALLLQTESPFLAFMDFSDWLWESSPKTKGKTSGITPENLVDALHAYLIDIRKFDAELVTKTLLADYIASGARARPDVLRSLIPKLPLPQVKAGKQLSSTTNAAFAKLAMQKPKLPKSHHYHVYVIELDDRVWNSGKFRRCNPEYVMGKPFVYVGMTGLDPDVRFDKHKAGIQANSFVTDYGVQLLPALYEKYNPMSYKAAQALEVELAIALQAKGYGVWQG